MAMKRAGSCGKAIMHAQSALPSSPAYYVKETMIEIDAGQDDASMEHVRDR